MHLRLFTVLTLATALLCVPGTRAAETLDLKFHPVKGQIQKLKMTVEQKLTNTFNGTAQSLSQSISLGYGFETLDVTAEGATVKVTYDTVGFKQVSALGTVEYDSAKPPTAVPPAARGFAALSGLTYTMKVTPDGKIAEVIGLSEMVDAILKKLDLPDNAAKPVIEKSVRKEFGEEAVRDNMEMMLAIFPDHPVAVGQSWTRKVAISKGIPVVMENTFTLKEATAEAVGLDVKSKISSNPDVAPVTAGNHTISYTLNGDVKGTMKVSRDSGWIRAAEMNQKVTGEMVTDAGAGRVTRTPIEAETKIVLESK